MKKILGENRDSWRGEGFMLTGKRFELAKSTLALDAAGKHGWVTVPAGAIIRVVAGPHGVGDRTVDVRWDGRSLAMFATDLVADGAQIDEVSA